MKIRSSGQPSNDTMKPELLLAPAGYVLINRSLELLALNHKARDYGMVAGDGLADYLEEQTTTRLRKLVDSTTNGMFEVNFLDGKRFEGHLLLLPASGCAGLWLCDVTELRFVQHQLQTLNKPDRKFLHKLNNLVSTTLGYCELVELMLEENPVLNGERLKAVRGYQQEINSGLRLTENHVQRERHTTIPSDSGRGGKQHALAVNSDTLRLEYLVELLQSQQFKVTSFTDSKAAREFMSLNPERINVAVVGEEQDLAEYLLEINSSLNILICANTEPAIRDRRIHFIPDRPLDINILMKALLEIEMSKI